MRKISLFALILLLCLVSCATKMPLQEFTIEYDLDGGHMPEGLENPSVYTEMSKPFTLVNPERKDYEFVGWTEELLETVKAAEGDAKAPVVDAEGEPIVELIEGTPVLGSKQLDEVVVETGNKGNRRFIAHWKPVEYKVEYDLVGGELPEGASNPETYTVETTGVSVVNPVKRGYEFAGWICSLTGEKYISIICDGMVPVSGDVKLTATWKLVDYIIEYELDNGILPKDEDDNEVKNPISYNVEMDGISVVNPTREHFVFVGWRSSLLDEKGENPCYKVIDGAIEDYFPEVGDVVLEAVWNPITYNIEYVDCIEYGPYPGIEVHYSNPNMTSYTVLHPSFWLVDPFREFYDFIGWRNVEDVEVLNPSTIFEPFSDYLVNTSIGKDLKFEAVWKPTEYTVSYDLSGGVLGSGHTIPESYNIESGSIVLPTPVLENYTFVGWKNTENGEVYSSYTLNEDIKGKNVELIAVWKPTDYKISYILNGGTYRFGVSNPTSYNVEGKSFKLNNPSRANYRFVGWRIKGFDEVYSEMSVPVVSGVYRDLELEAVWAPVSYRISYDLNGGYFTSRSKNLPSYTVETASFVLSIPSRKGYNFLGWVYSNDYAKDPVSSFRIDTSKAQNLEVEAVWIPVKYKLSYDLAGGSYQYGMSNPAYYTIESEAFVLCSPAKEGCRFIGWISSADPTGSVVKEPIVYNGTTGDIKFTAVYEPAGIPVGSATEMQLSKVVLGKDDIPRPDWVVKVPEDGLYHYERAFSSEEGFQNALQDATKKGYLQLAEWIMVNVSTDYSKFDSTDAATSHDMSVDVVVREREVVEYWEETNGTVWVLTRIPKSSN